MNKDSKHPDISSTTGLKPVSDAGRTRRTNEFREATCFNWCEKVGDFTTEAIKSEVRDIAKQEGLSAGVAAEALLRLGIETYLSTCETSVEFELPVSKPGSKAEFFVKHRQIQLASLPSSQPSIIGNPRKANQSGQVRSKPLVTYSSRTNQSTPDPTDTKPLVNRSRCCENEHGRRFCKPIIQELGYTWMALT